MGYFCLVDIIDGLILPVIFSIRTNFTPGLILPVILFHSDQFHTRTYLTSNFIPFGPISHRDLFYHYHAYNNPTQSVSLVQNRHDLIKNWFPSWNSRRLAHLATTIGVFFLWSKHYTTHRYIAHTGKVFSVCIGWITQEDTGESNDQHHVRSGR